MRLQLRTIVRKIPEGTYSGTIRSIYVSENEEFIWFKIKVNELDQILNTSLPLEGTVFKHFALDFLDEFGAYETDDFINHEVQFSVVDKKFKDSIYSRITEIEIFEDDESEEAE